MLPFRATATTARFLAVSMADAKDKNDQAVVFDLAR
jgi:hypothetical protein